MAKVYVFTRPYGPPPQVKPFAIEPDDLRQARRNLMDFLGASAFFAWASELPDGVVDDHKRYTDALKAEFERLTAEECDCNGANRDGCKLCTPVVDGEALPF